jgi:polyisoprenoid-binding protein YceI
MKRLSIIFFAFLSLSAFTTLNSGWTNDDAHSQLGFTVSHLGIADVSGTFNDFDVKITSVKPDFSDAVVELSAKTASIDTRVEDRDKHLMSPDFFDVKKYPAMTFKSTSVKKVAKNSYKLTGNLNLNGVTKPVTMDMVYKGTVENPMSKKQTAGVQVKGTIKRSDFNLGSNFPAPMISDEVHIKADGEFVQ